MPDPTPTPPEITMRVTVDAATLTRLLVKADGGDSDQATYARWRQHLAPQPDAALPSLLPGLALPGDGDAPDWTAEEQAEQAARDHTDG